MESGFSLTVCGLADKLVEVNPEWDSWAGIWIAVLSWGGRAVSESSSSINSASEIPPESCLRCCHEGVDLLVLSEET